MSSHLHGELLDTLADMVDWCDWLSRAKEGFDIVQVDPVKVLPAPARTNTNMRQDGDTPIIYQPRVNARLVRMHV